MQTAEIILKIIQGDYEWCFLRVAIFTKTYRGTLRCNVRDTYIPTSSPNPKS